MCQYSYLSLVLSIIIISVSLNYRFLVNKVVFVNHIVLSVAKVVR